jgi:sulfite exporter TauE/SafE
MCGPLACGVAALRGGGSRQTAAVLYHVGRLGAYGAIGAVAGATGRGPMEALLGGPAQVLPWFLVAVFVLVGVGFHHSVPVPALWRRWSLRARGALARLPVGHGALAAGLATPLLPCGPLYAMVGIALLSGSAARGVEFMLAFGLGTLPLLWVAQWQFHRLNRALAPVAVQRLRRGVALAAAAVMVWRLWPTPDPAICPLCL